MPGRRDSPPSQSRSQVRALQSELKTQTVEPRSSSSSASRLQYSIISPAGSSAHPSHAPNMASSAADESGYTMGGYTDLPPEQRPGYVPPQPQTQTYGGANIQYAQPAQGVTYTATPQQSTASKNAAQYNYAAISGSNTAALPVRTPSTKAGKQTTAQTAQGFQYAQLPGNLKFTAKPVTEQTPPVVPQVLHNTTAPNPHQQYNVITPTSPRDPHPANLHSQPFPNVQPLPPAPRSTHNGIAVVEITPGGSKQKPPPSPGLLPRKGSVSGRRPPAPSMPMGRPHSLSLSGPGRPDPMALPAPHRLSVGGLRPDISIIGPGDGPPPPSPLLEAYHGTYQDISPMPMPTHLPDDDIDDLSLLSPRISNSSVNKYAVVKHRRQNSHSDRSQSRRRSPSRGDRRSPTRRSPSRRGSVRRSPSRRSPSRDNRRSPSYSPPSRNQGHLPSRSPSNRKRVSMYDAERDARDIADSLSHSTPRLGILIEILPSLTHDQIMELRREYKRVCKVQGHGINIAKHIKLKASSHLGKIAYVTALGRWEGEGYWANYWYQSNSAKRELLIESLVGRTNAEIRAIKDVFKDKRYNDSLTKCMDKELKADKFRKAILMSLEERRQEEDQVWPREYVERDVDTLYEALRRREGGESAIIEIVVTRSDRHLRECLRMYERRYGGNFAKDALKKSNNLVGEIVAHILNGVINRPSRDAMLLHHALEDLVPNPAGGESKHERKDRYELLMSRLVRLHWDRLHFVKVKQEYREKYHHYLEEDLEHYIKNEDLAEFCVGLCEVKDR